MSIWWDWEAHSVFIIYIIYIYNQSMNNMHKSWDVLYCICKFGCINTETLLSFRQKLYQSVHRRLLLCSIPETLVKLNSLTAGRCGSNLWSNIWHTFCETDLKWSECHIIPMIINQHRFRICLGATRQQAITWANVDPDLYCYIVSLGHQELTRSVAPVHHEVIIRHNCKLFDI